MKSSLNDLQPQQFITNPKNNNIMRDYNKMRQEGWINQNVIEQELAQERRAARRAFQLKKAQIMANAEKICEQAKKEYLEQLKRINENRDEAIQFYDEVDGWMTEDVRPKTVGQFTGLHDKNGKEIYEGDVFKIDTLDGVISWHPNGYWCLHFSQDDVSEHSYISLGEVIEYAIREKYDYEVIGNIYDNPELMEGGQQ